MCRHAFLWLAACVLALFSTLSYAGSLRVGPTLVRLDSRHRVVALRVTNNNTVATPIEVQVMKWRQENNDDDYAATSELIVTPPIFELAPGETQIVRVGLRTAKSELLASAVEGSFRVFVSELPIEHNKLEPRTQMVLRVGIPVFVQAVSDEQAELRWQLTPVSENDWRLEVRNSGTTHVHILSVGISSRSVKLATDLNGLYVLPGARRAWTVRVNTQEPLEKVDLHIVTKDRTLEASLSPTSTPGNTLLVSRE
jgi:fimbrial chaperone protein